MKYRLGDCVKIIQEWNEKRKSNGIDKYMSHNDGEVGKLVGIRTSKKSEGESISLNTFHEGYKYCVKINKIHLSLVVFKIRKATKQEIKEYMIDEL